MSSTQIADVSNTGTIPLIEQTKGSRTFLLLISLYHIIYSSFNEIVYL